ncbi:MAG: molybdopterin-dependent oxidoreductase, partial [Anaerolineales bacterium]|nr:molybdopterin-dependent oxidoreductase [Anaerolineales bacterium]
CILAIGTNTTAAHPVIGHRMRRAAQNGTKLIVANPKEIDLVRSADLFIQHRPGSDVALLMGMMRVIVDEGLEDAAFIAERCENFEAFRQSLADYPLALVQDLTGVPWQQIVAAARMLATHQPAAIFYAMGITQHTHGTDNVLAVANLALLIGAVGRYGSGVNPLRGQNNVQGACDMGALPNVYPGYQRVGDPAARQKFEAAWGVPLPADDGLTHVEIFDAVATGQIEALYLVGENPLLTEANANHVRAALETLDFLVVQDIFLSETAAYADVVLPAASYAEKDGTFTNTERRVQRVRRAIPPVGDSRPDWWITAQIGQRLGAAGFDYADAAAIMAEINAVTPSYAGITYARLEAGGLQWPCPTVEHPGTPFLHRERFARPNGLAQFVPLAYRPPAEWADETYPLVLTTDRSLYHYHSSTMTRRVAGLEALDGEERLKINPVDAAALGVVDGEVVRVRSRRGQTTVRARVTEICPPGVVSMTFHFVESPTNVLTNAALDPVAKIPETKVAAVRVEKAADVGDRLPS